MEYEKLICLLMDTIHPDFLPGRFLWCHKNSHTTPASVRSIMSCNGFFLNTLSDLNNIIKNCSMENLLASHEQEIKKT